MATDTKVKGKQRKVKEWASKSRMTYASLGTLVTVNITSLITATVKLSQDKDITNPVIHSLVIIFSTFSIILQLYVTAMAFVRRADEEDRKECFPCNLCFWNKILLEILAYFSMVFTFAVEVLDGMESVGQGSTVYEAVPKVVHVFEGNSPDQEV